MRIAYLNPSGQLGGAEVSLLDFLASLRQAEPDWTLRLIVAEDGPFVKRAQTIGVETIILPFSAALARLGDAGVGGPSGKQQSHFALIRKLGSAGAGIAIYVKQLRQILRKFAPDLIHTNGFKMHILGTWSCPHRVPMVWHIHDYVSMRPVMIRLLRRYASRCAAVVANSKSVANDVAQAFAGRLKIYTIYNAVDLERFSPNGKQLDLDQWSNLPPADPGTLRIGLLATFARWKGHEVFLKALSLLPASLKIRGYIIGGAIYQTDGSQFQLDELRSTVNCLGLTGRVGFTGFVEEPEAAMRALDVVVHASTKPEPFGLVIAEAMACGRAVIASQAGGAAEIIHNGEDALGHTPGNAESLANCINQLSENADLRAQLGVGGRATAESKFNRARLATELIPIYRMVMMSPVT
jgi:glycosyltransferase involved in cell wall biosynthesis